MVTAQGQLRGVSGRSLSSSACGCLRLRSGRRLAEAAYGRGSGGADDERDLVAAHPGEDDVASWCPLAGSRSWRRSRSASTLTPRFLMVSRSMPWSRSQPRSALTLNGIASTTAYRLAKGTSTDRLDPT